MMQLIFGKLHFELRALSGSKSNIIATAKIDALNGYIETFFPHSGQFIISPIVISNLFNSVFVSDSNFPAAHLPNRKWVVLDAVDYSYTLVTLLNNSAIFSAWWLPTKTCCCQIAAAHH